jgi:hypothetical protein
VDSAQGTAVTAVVNLAKKDDTFVEDSTSGDDWN